MTMKQFLPVCALAVFVVVPAPQLAAQEIVHALCGTVSSIDATGKTITLFQDTGSPASFNVMSSSNTRIAFDKKVAAEVTEARKFQKQGAYVILFYFGTDGNRTAVALKNLGSGPFSSTTGEVTQWNGRSNQLSLRDKNGAVHSFKIDDQTVGETYTGVVNGSKFDVDKGEKVRLVSSTKDGAATVLFIRQE